MQLSREGAHLGADWVPQPLFHLAHRKTKYFVPPLFCTICFWNQTVALKIYHIMRPTDRQSQKIAELKDALIREGYRTLNAQAKALGLNRATTWTILKANHKASGLSASVISRMLRAPQLPPSVREKIIEYVEEKRAGLYGHNKRQIERFAAGLPLQLLVPSGNVNESPTSYRN